MSFVWLDFRTHKLSHKKMFKRKTERGRKSSSELVGLGSFLLVLLVSNRNWVRFTYLDPA